MKRSNFNKSSSTKPKVHSGHRFVMGRNAAREVLRRDPNRVIEAHISDGAMHDEAEIVSLLKSNRIQFNVRQREELDDLVSSESHQGVALVVKERYGSELKSFIESSKDLEKSLILIIDSVSDPQNFGSLLRAAECAGVSAVIVSKNRGISDVTATVSKTSVGASEILDIIKVPNLAEAVRRIKDAGYWIVSSVLHPEAESIYNFDFPDKTAIIVGAEGDGIQPLLVKESDFKVFIPLEGDIQSLNVSQAATVFLFSYRRCLNMKGS